MNVSTEGPRLPQTTGPTAGFTLAHLGKGEARDATFCLRLPWVENHTSRIHLQTVHGVTAAKVLAVFQEVVLSSFSELSRIQLGDREYTRREFVAHVQETHLGQYATLPPGVRGLIASYSADDAVQLLTAGSKEATDSVTALEFPNGLRKVRVARYVRQYPNVRSVFARVVLLGLSRANFEEGDEAKKLRGFRKLIRLDFRESEVDADGFRTFGIKVVESVALIKGLKFLYLPPDPDAIPEEVLDYRID